MVSTLFGRRCVSSIGSDVVHKGYVVCVKFLVKNVFARETYQHLDSDSPLI